MDSKEVLKKYIPKKYVDRPKMGFSIPIDLWLRTSLNNWSRKILDKDKIIEQNILNPSTVNRMLKLHTSGKKIMELNCGV